jgi:3-deoxy-D-manno-octulosonate cytidylyltransferase
MFGNYVQIWQKSIEKNVFIMLYGKKVVAIIPARFASSRFPGKPLADLGGKPMIQRTYERVKAVEGFDRIVIATDDKRIFDAAKVFGAEVMMTSTEHPTGTDRCAEVLSRLGEAVDYVINIQGDEPFIDADPLQKAIEVFKNDLTKQVDLASVMREITNEDDFVIEILDYLLVTEFFVDFYILFIYLKLLKFNMKLP